MVDNGLENLLQSVASHLATTSSPAVGPSRRRGIHWQGGLVVLGGMTADDAVTRRVNASIWPPDYGHPSQTYRAMVWMVLAFLLGTRGGFSMPAVPTARCIACPMRGPLGFRIAP